jgi:hypothetical protein
MFFSLHRSLKPFIHSLKEKKKAAGGFQGQNSLLKHTHTHTHTHTICASPKHGPWKGSFTSSPLTSVHLYIPHCWPLRGPFLELTPIGSYQPYPSHPPNHFSTQLNHIQSSWRKGQYIPPKCWKTSTTQCRNPKGDKMINGCHENQETYSTITDNRWRNYWSSWDTEEYLQ